MKIKLKKFDLLYEQLVGEKRANIFTKVFTNQRYLQDDFRQVWKGSGFKKLMAAFDNALGKNSKSKLIIKDLPDLDVNKILDLKSQIYEDLSAGTVQGGNAGLRLTYDILPEYKYTLLKILVSRDENTNGDSSKFGMFLNYFNQLISASQQGLQGKFIKRIKEIPTDMKLEIIAVPKNNGKNNNDFTANKKHSHLSQSSFDCNIYLWFDAQGFKNELRENLKQGLNVKDSASDADTTSKAGEETADTLARQQKDIQSINVNTSKIKLGHEDIRIEERNDGTLTNLWEGLKNYNLQGQALKLAGNALGLNKIFGGKQQNTEKPDKVRVNQHFWHSLFNVGDINNPYVNVISIVNLQPWLYKDNYNKSVTDIQKGKNTNFAIELRKPFDQALLKLDKDSPGVLNGNLSNSKVWRINSNLGKSLWPSQSTKMEDYLKTETSDTITKKITCRWQYYLDKTRALYAQYRVAIELTEFYKLLDSFENKLSSFQMSIDNLQSSQHITASDIKKAIDIIKKDHADYIIRDGINQTSNNQQVIVHDTLEAISQLIFLLKQPGDNSSPGSVKGINNHVSTFSVLFNLLNKNIFKVKKYGERQVDYNDMPADKLFSLWWKNYYVQVVRNSNGKNGYSLSSQKSIYTTKNMSPNNNIPTHAQQGFQAFLDIDTTAANYFNTKILDQFDPFTLNGVSLNEFYLNEFKQNCVSLKIDNDKLKDYLNVFYQLNNIMIHINNYISSTSNSNRPLIERKSKSYIISMNL